MKTVSSRTLASMAGALVPALGLTATGSGQTTMPPSSGGQGMMGGMHPDQNGMGGMHGMKSCMHAMKDMHGKRGMQHSQDMAGGPCAHVEGMHTMEAAVTSATPGPESWRWGPGEWRRSCTFPGSRTTT